MIMDGIDWQTILETYGSLSFLVPVLVVSAESFLPFLPLTAIVAWNIAAYGVLSGTLYSWLGNCLGCTIVFTFWRLFRRRLSLYAEKHGKAAEARLFVQRMRPAALFLIIMMPFTPSSFVNFAFGISDYNPKRYLLTLYAAKTVMIFLLALIGHSIVLSFDSPYYLIPAAGLILLLWYLSRKIDRNTRI